MTLLILSSVSEVGVGQIAKSDEGQKKEKN